jgi:hypothetical protein
MAPAPCSDHAPLLGLDVLGTIAVGGFVDPTYSLVRITLHNRVLTSDKPNDGSVLLLAQVGSEVQALRDDHVITEYPVKRITGTGPTG